jgi:hypothetical protein
MLPSAAQMGGSRMALETSRGWMERSVRSTIDLVGLITYRCVYTDAMQIFAQAEDKWYKTWPESEEDRAMRMYVVSTPFYGCALTVRLRRHY